MKPEWKKPWSILAWLFEKEKFQPEKGPGPDYSSRIGSKGFIRWFFESEKESFHEEPEAEIGPSRFGKGGFLKWIFSVEKLEVGSEIAVSEPVPGGRSFFRWLFSSEECPSQGENSPNGDSSKKGL